MIIASQRLLKTIEKIVWSNCNNSLRNFDCCEWWIIDNYTLIIYKTWGNYAFQALCLRQCLFPRCFHLFHHFSLLLSRSYIVVSSQWHVKKETMWKQALFPHMCLHLKSSGRHCGYNKIHQPNVVNRKCFRKMSHSCLRN